jgi:ParB family chromosome partitioning protein
MATETTTTRQVETIPVSSIIAGNNDRKTFDAKALRELADSIMANGLVQPITVRPTANLLGDETFEIVAGERRYRAHVLAGLDTIDAMIVDLDDRRTSDVMLVENTGRVDLDPIEEANAYAKRIDEGQTVEEIAAVAGVAVFRVNWRLSLLNLREEAMTLLSGGNLGMSDALQIAKLERNRQAMVLHTMAKEDLPPSAVKALCERLLADQQQDGLFDENNFLQIEEWAAQAKTKGLGKAGLLKLVERLTNQLEGLAPADDDVDSVTAALIAEARAVLA